jgi:twinkle protein
MEINGFEIEKFNQYGFSENVKQSTCPICSHNRKKSSDKCMSLHWDSGLGVCHHCGEVIQLHTFKKKAGSEKIYTRPEWKNNTQLSDKLVTWFECRGISQFTLRLMKITEGTEWMPQVKADRNTIQFNYFRDAELINVKYRDGAKNFKLTSGAELIFYNLDCIKYSEAVIITEGEIDALSYIECGLHHTVSMPNGSTKGAVNLQYLDNCIDYFENKKKIYLALDNDEAGQNVQKEMIRRFGTGRCFIVDFRDCKDANEYIVKYGKDALTKTITEAKEVPIEGVMSVNDFRESFETYLKSGMKKGFQIGKPFFDDMFSTYTGQYIVVTGIPSHGKSDFVDDMVLGYCRKYDWRAAMCSVENKPSEIHAGKLLAKCVGTWVTNEKQIAEDWFPKAVDYLDDKIKFIDLKEGHDLDKVLEITERLIFKYGIKCLVLDPYNKIRLKRSLNKNINEYTNDYLITIDDFCRKHDILIILVAHPRKPTFQETKTFVPSFYDIKGGGEFYDMSPHGILVHRDFEHDCTMVKVLKCKFSHLGKNNEHTYLKWNRNNGRFDQFAQDYKNPAECSVEVADNDNYFSDKVNALPIVEKHDFDPDVDFWNNTDEESPF